MKENFFQKVISWAYVKWVLMPKVRQGYSVKISLLSDEEAEAYLEVRRQFLAANGRPIRKIIQAFLAFHGSYAASPASVSPINEQLQELRRRSDSLEDFLKLVASFGSIQEFTDYLDEA